jgi:hypothetical protein
MYMVRTDVDRMEFPMAHFTMTGYGLANYASGVVVQNNRDVFHQPLLVVATPRITQNERRTDRIVHSVNRATIITV